MNPFSLLTFHRRHKRRAALLLGLFSLVTVGLYLLVALLWAIAVEPMRSNYLYLNKYSVVHGWEPTVVAQIRANPDVARTVAATIGPGVQLPDALGGGSNYWNLFALMEEDVAYVMERCGATLKEGQPLQPRTNGIMLSHQVAANLGIGVGDTVHNAVNPELFGNIPAPLQVVGILESDVRLSIASYEYLNDHELFRRMIMPRLLVMARPGREDAVAEFLRHDVQAAGTSVETYQGMATNVARAYRATMALVLPIVVSVTVALLFVIAIINRVAFAQRVREFGLLHAAGHNKNGLIRRVTAEAAVLAAGGWMMGIWLSWIILYLLKLAVFVPRGHHLNVISVTPALPVLLVPMAVIMFTFISARRVLSQLDPVAVVERAELSLEHKPPQGAKALKRSSRPLAAWTFHRRHRRQAILTIAATALMIIAVVMYIFVTTAVRDTRRASLGHLDRVSVVSPRIGSGPDATVAAQVRTHPSVERVMPFTQFTMLTVLIPPGETAPINPYAVYADDMAYLVDLYCLELKHGHLPRPHTNELVIPEVVAQNRDLQIGDIIGDPDHPAFPGASHISVPTEFVISGIFNRPKSAAEDNWLALISLEYIESHEAYNILGHAATRLIVVPKTGEKVALDDWLEDELASDDVVVRTYRQSVSRAEERTRTQIFTIALLESLIALVAATALAGLNYISISGRRAEFGVLHALGHGRRRLVARALGETAFTTGAAWGLSAFLFLCGLLFLQIGVFEPLGLRLDFTNFIPWLFTLPIPVAIFAVSSITIAWTLSKLDPVSLIERR